jgi:glycosyltransferase involved in cell wall biosynthesis
VIKHDQVLWEPVTPIMATMFRQRRPSPGALGGEIYNLQAALAIAEKFEVQMSERSIRRSGEGTFAYWRRIRREHHDAALVIQQPLPVAFGRRSPGVRYAGIIHHIDIELGRSSLSHRWYFRRLQRRLAALDVVFTVSKFSADYLRQIGCRDVRVIYNSFNLSDFEVSDSERRAFRQRYGFPDDRPVIYIGNAAPAKGVHDVYAALRNEPYHLVMSGPRNDAADLPVQFLKLDRRDYVCLLHNCDVVISMSRMTEGWNRIAHEAMLCRRPVIGSGSGGMRELLEGGGQRIVTTPIELPAAVAEALSRKSAYGASGLRFVEQFDQAYFCKAWQDAVTDILAR